MLPTPTSNMNINSLVKQSTLQYGRRCSLSAAMETFFTPKYILFRNILNYISTPQGFVCEVATQNH